MPLLATRGNAPAGAYGFGSAAGEELGGMVLLTPTSIAYSGTSASVGANGSVEFSAVTSLSLNGVFSSSYDNYMIVGRTYGTADSGAFDFRLRVSGTDNSTASSYVSQRLLGNNATVSGVRDTDAAWKDILRNYANYQMGTVTHIYGPYLAQPTAHRIVSAWSLSTGGTIHDRAGTHNQSTSYDGFTIFTGTAGSGSISVYGLVGA